jgi:uncharacterized protein YecT (DUF1311 family)
LSQAELKSPDETLVPRGAEEPSFDCEKARSAAARLICADRELARLDGELGVVFQKRKAQVLGQDRSKVVSEQLAWINERNTLCQLIGKDSLSSEALAGNKPCMMAETQKRIAVLAQTESVGTIHCYRDGEIVTVQGITTAQPLQLANGSVKSIWLLVTDRPICVMEAPNGIEAPHETSVSRLQIIGQPPPSNAAVELTGKLSTGNISQYYAESTAINVISGRRIAVP